jgi:hypothetical protein
MTSYNLENRLKTWNKKIHKLRYTILDDEKDKKTSRWNFYYLVENIDTKIIHFHD